MNKRVDKVYDLIEDYLRGRLNSQEKIDFESRLSVEDDLKLQLKMHQLADDLVIEKRLLQVKEVMKSEHQKLEHRSKLVKKIAVASVIVVAVLALITFIMLNKKGVEDIRPIPAGKAAQKKVSETSIKPSASPKGNDSYGNGISGTIKSKTIISEQKITDKDKSGLPVSSGTQEKSIVPVSPEVLQHSTIKPDTLTVDPCKHALTATVTTRSTCPGTEEGEIQVSNFSGGTGAYRCEIADAQGNPVHATGLKAGTYVITLSDGNGCRKIYENTVVSEKVCPKDYILNLSNQEILTIPTREIPGKLKVYSKSGMVVYESVTHGNSVTWNGEGMESTSGYYIFAVEYSDGTADKGTITVLK